MLFATEPDMQETPEKVAVKVGKNPKGEAAARPVSEQAGEYNTPVFNGVKKPRQVDENRVKLRTTKKAEEGEV